MDRNFCSLNTSIHLDTAWAKNEGGFEFQGHENKELNKIFQKSCNMLVAGLEHIVSCVSIQNSDKKYYFLGFFIFSGAYLAAYNAIRSIQELFSDKS